MTENKKEPPTTLTALAAVNFFFTATLIFSFAYTVYKGELTEYIAISQTVTAVLLVLSGFGFLKMSYTQGYILGNIFAVFALVNITIYGLFFDEHNFLIHVPSLIYPLALLFLLNIKLKQYFS